MGGNAFKGKTRRITCDEVHITRQWIQDNWAGPKLEPWGLTYLGSAGKSATSGDIDFNMGEDWYDLHEVGDGLVKMLGPDNVQIRPGHKQIFTAVPIKGNEQNGFVQVDFMFGNREWQHFSYFSPEVGSNRTWDSSKYKGLFRTELIKAMVAFNSTWVLEENGEMVARVGPTFFHDRGVIWRYRYRPFKKDGSGQRIKALKEVTKEEFLEIFPTAIPAPYTATQRPDEVISLILGKVFGQGHLVSYEKLWAVAHQCYTNEQLFKISELYLQRLNSLKVEIPAEILREHTKRLSEYKSVYRGK